MEGGDPGEHTLAEAKEHEANRSDPRKECEKAGIGRPNRYGQASAQAMRATYPLDRGDAPPPALGSCDVANPILGTRVGAQILNTLGPCIPCVGENGGFDPVRGYMYSVIEVRRRNGSGFT